MDVSSEMNICYSSPGYVDSFGGKQVVHDTKEVRNFERFVEVEEFALLQPEKIQFKNLTNDTAYMLGLFAFLLTASIDLPTYNPGDPSYYATFAAALILVIVVLGLSLAAALRNPRMVRTRKEAQ